MSPATSVPGAPEANPYVQVKICGITREEDARAAERHGADAVGFVFAPGSKRQVNAARARALSAVLGPFVARVGVFVNEPLEGVLRTVTAAQLTAVQLHGSEGAEYAAALQQHVKVIRAVPHSEAPDPAALAGFPASAFLLDAPVPGSGETFPWQTVQGWRGHPRLLLAGGLTPGNVGRAVTELRPMGVDVSSGVEVAPGVKSEELIRLFVAAARRGSGVAERQWSDR